VVLLTSKAGQASSNSDEVNNLFDKNRDVFNASQIFA